MSVRTILFIGKPGSGKETQIRLLKKRTGFKIISIGRCFRIFQKKSGKLAKAVRHAYKTGSLEPSWLADYCMSSGFVETNDRTGIIFDGAGRTLLEAKLFDKLSHWSDRKYAVMYLDITDKEAMQRQLDRKRNDSDSKKKIRVRLIEFTRHTKPAVKYFKQKRVLIPIPAEGAIEKIHAHILRKLKKK